MTGRVIASACGTYSILSNGNVFNAKARKNIKSNFGKIVVGDFVDFDEKLQIIENVKERTNYCKRPTIANIDQVVIVLSLKEPEFDYCLALKFLTYCNMNNLTPILMITKIDLAKDDGEIKEIKTVFDALNIRTLFISNKKQIGHEEAKQLFKNKVTCLMGQTGVGKSSLLNVIDSSFIRSVGEYSVSRGRGKHQTKEVVLLNFSDGLIADTPGFSSFDLGLFKEDLAQFFPGFNNFVNCMYRNCLHISENRCAIKELVNNGSYPKVAYDAYIRLSNEALAKNQRYSK